VRVQKPVINGEAEMWMTDYMGWEFGVMVVYSVLVFEFVNLKCKFNVPVIRKVTCEFQKAKKFIQMNKNP
jgi:hypothetical protein